MIYVTSLEGGYLYKLFDNELIQINQLNQGSKYY